MEGVCSQEELLTNENDKHDDSRVYGDRYIGRGLESRDRTEASRRKALTWWGEEAVELVYVSRRL